MDIQALGYVGVRASSLEDWTSFGTRFLGMQIVDKTNRRIALRMDDCKQRIVVNEDGGEGVAFFGWEAADAAALERCAARLEHTGVPVSRNRAQHRHRPAAAVGRQPRAVQPKGTLQCLTTSPFSALASWARRWLPS